MSFFTNQSATDQLSGSISDVNNASHASGLMATESSLAAGSSLKRGFDITFSLTVLVVLLPVMLLIALAVKLDSPGPVFFKQARWGKGQKQIRILKFRSMRTDLCDASGVSQTIDGDPRVTRLGSFLRKSSLDELPQFINVLMGDMSVVGPRCHAIGMIAAGVPYEQLVFNYHHRHEVRPGITGLAQVRGWRGPTVDPVHARARIAADLHYIENYSFWLDVQIIMATIRNEVCGGTGL